MKQFRTKLFSETTSPLVKSETSTTGIILRHAKRFFSAKSKEPQYGFLKRMEHAEIKEKQKLEKHSVKISQKNKGVARNTQKKVGKRNELPDKPFLNFMEADNVQFLSEAFVSHCTVSYIGKLTLYGGRRLELTY